MQLNVQHPAAKSMIEVARTQDEETGDGTKSVIILGNFQSFMFYIIHVLWNSSHTIYCLYQQFCVLYKFDIFYFIFIFIYFL